LLNGAATSFTLSSRAEYFSATLRISFKLLHYVHAMELSIMHTNCIKV
jgi:hypothetical protein